MNIFLTRNRASEQFLAVLVVLSLVLSFLPFSAHYAAAASTGVTLSESATSTPVDTQVNFVAMATDDGTTTPGTYISVDDNGGGGDFYNGTITGDCSNVTPDADNEFSIISNKGVCYANSTPGVYDVGVQLLDGPAGLPIGSPATIEITVECTPQFDVTGPTNIYNSDTGEYFDTVADALADCDTSDGDTIELAGDLVGTSMQITLDRPITLDGNDYTVSPTFSETDNDNNAAIGVIGTTGVTIKDLTIDGSGGTDLHGINVYESTGVVIENVSMTDVNRSGIVVNGSTVTARDLSTSGSGWNGVNVAQGSGVTDPSVFNVESRSEHDEAAHIFIDNIAQDVTVNDIDGQYEIVYEGPHPNPQFQTTARVYNLKQTAKIIAHKIVCTDESELPNWGGGASDIDADTAADWVDEYDSCEFAEGWEFEWGPSNAGDPGDTATGTAGGLWNTFGPTDSEGMAMAEVSTTTIAENSRLWFREVLQDGYIPFTHGPNGGSNSDDFTAEVYCHQDVKNYDNYDRIDGPENRGVYHCVAWNHAEEVFGCTDPEAVNYDPAATSDDDSCVYEQFACQIGDNLLTNPSFEDPVIQGSWTITGVTDWIVSKVSDNSVTDGEIWNNFMGGASDGDQNLELDVRESTQVAQTVTTIPGATYEFRFDFSPRKGSDASNNSVDALIDGTFLINASGDGSNNQGNVWSTYAETFVADDGTTTVALRDMGVSNGTGSLVDNAALCLISEPEPQDPWCSFAGTVIEYTEEPEKNNGQPVAAERRNPTAVETVAPYQNIGGSEGNDWQVDPLDFFTLGIGGYLIYEFTEQVAVDQAGDDIAVYEITGGSNDTGEMVKVSVSQNGTDFVEVGTITGDGAVDISGAGLEYVKYVRLDDMSQGVQGPGGDGYDVDAIVILEGSCADEPVPTHMLPVCSDYFTEGYVFTQEQVLLSHDAGGAFIGPDNVFIPAGYYDINALSYEDHTNNLWDTQEFEQWYVNLYASNTLEFTSLTTVDVPTGVDFQFSELDRGVKLPEIDAMEWIHAAHPNPDYHSVYPICIQFLPAEEPLVCEPGVNLIANGSFEEPEVDGAWDIFDLTTYPALAWAVEFVDNFTGAPDEASLELQRSVSNWDASDGEQYAELDSDWEGPGGGSGEEASVAISQTIPTIAGETYTLSWDFSARPNTTEAENDLVVEVDGLEVANNEAAGGGTTAWASYSHTFTADEETEIVFYDDGNPNSAGTFLDNVALSCVPELDYGPYCGDGVVGGTGQEWEQCEPGDTDCTQMCTFANQCSTLQLVKIDLEQTQSTSFDGKLYLGSATNPIPSGVWFQFDGASDDSANSVADSVDGLAIERDPTDGLQLAFRGDNDSQDLDIVAGTIEFKNLLPGVVTPYIMGTDYSLEDTAPAFIDIFDEINNEYIEFDMRADTGNDGVTLALAVDEDAIAACDPEDSSGYSCSISASPNPVTSGESFTLSWSTTGGAYVDIDELGANLATTDSTTTAITETTTYTLSVYDDSDDANLLTQCSVEVGVTTSGGGGGSTGGGAFIQLQDDGDGNGDGSSSDDSDAGPAGIVDGASDSRDSLPQVMGEQVSIIPAGAPNTGAGGTDRSALPLIVMFAVLGVVAYATGKRYAF